MRGRTITFEDRRDAGQRLALALIRFKDEKPVVLALPRGGIPVAREVATALAAPLDLVLARKIGVPMQPEFAMGAVAEGNPPLVVRSELVIRELEISDAEFNATRDRAIAEIERRRLAYLGGRPRAEIGGKVAVVVDDGIATGMTMTAAVRSVRSRAPRKLVLAVPVASPEALEALSGEVDEIVCLERPVDLRAIGFYYRDFAQVNDDDVRRMMAGV